MNAEGEAVPEFAEPGARGQDFRELAEGLVLRDLPIKVSVRAAS